MQIYFPLNPGLMNNNEQKKLVFQCKRSKAQKTEKSTLFKDVFVLKREKESKKIEKEAVKNKSENLY